MGIEYSYTGNATHAWLTVLLMDVWHWTPLVALLAFAGLRSIPTPLPGRAHRRRKQVRGVPLHPAAQDARRADDCRAAALHGQLRMIYTEPLRCSPAAGRQRHHLPQRSVPDQKAVGQFDLGPAAAFSLIYFLIILLLCLGVLQLDAAVGTADRGNGHE